MGEFVEKVMEKRDKLEKLAGFPCRVNSSADLRRLLISQYGIAPTLLTPKGEPSMNAEALEQMLDNESGNAVKVEILELVKTLKHEFSVVNTSKELPNWLDENGFLHPSVEQIGYDGTARVYCLTGDNKIELDGKLYTIEEVAAWRETGMI